MVKRFFLNGVIIIFVITPFLFAQELTLQRTISRSNSIQFNKIASLTAFARNNIDSLNPDSSFTTVKPSKEVNKKFRMKKSPLAAVLLSAVIPGAGQFYNQSYWKIPIIGGLIGYFGYEYINQNNKYKDYRDQYSVSQTPENPSGNLSLKNLREFYRGQRDDFIWYFTIVYVINLVDAYVDAHLFDFDVKDEKLTHFGKTNRTYRLKLNLKL
jgi:hypothetical protein